MSNSPIRVFGQIKFGVQTTAKINDLVIYDYTIDESVEPAIPLTQYTLETAQGLPASDFKSWLINAFNAPTPPNGVWGIRIFAGDGETVPAFDPELFQTTTEALLSNELNDYFYLAPTNKFNQAVVAPIGEQEQTAFQCLAVALKKRLQQVACFNSNQASAYDISLNTDPQSWLKINGYTAWLTTALPVSITDPVSVWVMCYLTQTDARKGQVTFEFKPVTIPANLALTTACQRLKGMIAPLKLNQSTTVVLSTNGADQPKIYQAALGAIFIATLNLRLGIMAIANELNENSFIGVVSPVWKQVASQFISYGVFAPFPEPVIYENRKFLGEQGIELLACYAEEAIGYIVTEIRPAQTVSAIEAPVYQQL